MTRPAIAARIATLTGYFGLFALLMLWNTVLAPSEYFPTALVLLVMVGPLLFPLRGLLAGRPYTHAWTSFLSLAYFVHGVGVAYAEPDERALASLEIGFSALLFLGTIFFARYRSRELRGLRTEEVARTED